ncbi:MAG: hypothetical protein RR212_01655 [Bacteroidales bacterium]
MSSAIVASVIGDSSVVMHSRGADVCFKRDGCVPHEGRMCASWGTLLCFLKQTIVSEWQGSAPREGYAEEPSPKAKRTIRKWEKK